MPFFPLDAEFYLSRIKGHDNWRHKNCWLKIFVDEADKIKEILRFRDSFLWLLYTLYHLGDKGAGQGVIL